MNKSNRDLLVLFNQELMTPQAIEHEVEMLHELLYNIERLDHQASAYEVIDLNKYKVIRKQHKVLEFFMRRSLKPFLFFNCLN